VSLLFIDIDNFKYYNDLYGHQKGDDVLRSIALIMKATFPKDTFLARYGGEEFVALLTGYDEAQAIAEAEKLRRAVQEYPFDGQENLPGANMTVRSAYRPCPARSRPIRNSSRVRTTPATAPSSSARTAWSRTSPFWTNSISRPKSSRRSKR
jgi:GGDEF domain-containing protein